MLSAKVDQQQALLDDVVRLCVVQGGARVLADVQQSLQHGRLDEAFRLLGHELTAKLAGIALVESIVRVKEAQEIEE